jgi:hypothetical protein
MSASFTRYERSNYSRMKAGTHANEQATIRESAREYLGLAVDFEKAGIKSGPLHEMVAKIRVPWRGRPEAVRWRRSCPCHRQPRRAGWPGQQTKIHTVMSVAPGKRQEPPGRTPPPRARSTPDAPSLPYPDRGVNGLGTRLLSFQEPSPLLLLVEGLSLCEVEHGRRLLVVRD